MIRHNIFISHRHADDELVGRLKVLLRSHGVKIRDSSITSDTPNHAHADSYIKEILAARIRWAGKVVVIVSPDTINHDWVVWEIHYTRRYPRKLLIGVWAPGARGVDMPVELATSADAIVGWNGDAIVAALGTPKT